LGDSTKTITVYSNATLEVWGLTAGPLNKKIIMQDGSKFFSESGITTNAGTIALQGNVTFNIGGTSLYATNVISGTGSLTKIGNSPLYLIAVNTYSGGTFINTGTLALLHGGRLAGTTNIVIASGALLDVSGTSDTTASWVLGNNQ